MGKPWAYGKNISYLQFILATGNPGFNAFRRYQQHGFGNPAGRANISPRSKTYTKPDQYSFPAALDSKATIYTIDRHGNRKVVSSKTWV
jgi:hypothetical protein